MNEFCTCQFIYSKSGKINYSINSTNGFDLENYMKDVEWGSIFSKGLIHMKIYCSSVQRLHRNIVIGVC